ncbi:MAG: sulfatase [Candidatus Brocadiia bacterium]
MSRPNIIYIFTDQQSADAMSCAGNEYLQTPAMDRLAETGSRFDRAYTSFPLCVPARMSMFTGRMPHELGIYANCAPAEEPPGVPMLGALMREGGYDCHYVGKWHKTVPQDASDIHGFPRVDFGGGYGGKDSEKAERAVEIIRDDHEDPLFMVVSFTNPHDACELARGDDLRMGELPPMPPEDQLPPLPDNWQGPEREPEVVRRFQEQHDSIGLAQDWDALQTRRFRWGYNRLVEMVDRELSRIMEALEEEGLMDDTVVIFSSDHGDGQGSHRWNQKWSLYEESARVPFIVKPPAGQGPAGSTPPVLANASLDLLPTILDYAGLQVPAGCPGESLRSVINNGETGASNRPYVACETEFGTWAEVGDDQWPKGRMIRTDRYKYMAYDEGEHPEQLFDMDNDPGETVDLAEREEYREVLNTHRDHLREWTARTDDNFDVPE